MITRVDSCNDPSFNKCSKRDIRLIFCDKRWFIIRFCVSLKTTRGEIGEEKLLLVMINLVRNTSSKWSNSDFCMSTLAPFQIYKIIKESGDRTRRKSFLTSNSQSRCSKAAGLVIAVDSRIVSIVPTRVHVKCKIWLLIRWRFFKYKSPRI